MPCATLDVAHAVLEFMDIRGLGEIGLEIALLLRPEPAIQSLQDSDFSPGWLRLGCYEVAGAVADSIFGRT